MANPSLHPLEINPETQEPYLRLLPPHEHIVMTPPRPSDSSAIPPIFNDRRVYMTLSGPPYPYTEEHAADWVRKVTETSNAIMSELRDRVLDGGTSLTSASGCPVNILREVREDGTDIFIGDLGIYKCRWSEVKDKELQEKLATENEARSAGDPESVWEFRGDEHLLDKLRSLQMLKELSHPDYLAASHHGQGIMSTAVKTLLEKWAIPRMGVRKMHVTTFEGNRASVRVFEKNGFTLRGTVEDCLEIQKSKGGGRTGLHVLDWSL